MGLRSRRGWRAHMSVLLPQAGIPVVRVYDNWRCSHQPSSRIFPVRSARSTQAPGLPYSVENVGCHRHWLHSDLVFFPGPALRDSAVDARGGAHAMLLQGSDLLWCSDVERVQYRVYLDYV